MKKFCNVITILFIFLQTTQSLAANFDVWGIIKDKKNNNPLPGANIMIKGTSIGTSSNEEGYYILRDLKVGNYVIQVSYIGYNTYLDTILIDNNIEKTSMDILLTYKIIEGNEVLVMSQAKGQMDAINKQLNAKSIVNIISSDRIQDLPDANAAETVARIPGISVSREGGEGNKVIIRGLSPKYNSITVNNVKIASTDNNNRSTDLSMVSQYALEEIQVIKAGTPDQDGDVLGGTVNFQLKKAKKGFHGNLIVQGMHNGLRNTNEDTKFIVGLSKRFWNNRLGILAQIDTENRNRSSHEIMAGYNLYNATLDTAGQLQLIDLTLIDWARINNRKNILQVFDINIPKGNLSFSYFLSSIDKDIDRYGNNYPLGYNTRLMSSARGMNSTGFSLHSVKYEQTIFKNLFLDIFFSRAHSKNENKSYNFNFSQDFAYNGNTFDKSINHIMDIVIHDIRNMDFESYNHQLTKSDERENSFGLNMKYAFRVNNFLSGDLKFGIKSRTKNRVFDRQVEFGNIGGSRFSNIRNIFIDEFKLDSFIVNPGRLSLLAFIKNDYNNDNFFKGSYPFSAVADLDFMMDVYHYFSANFNSLKSSTNSDADVLHILDQTSSIVYDYYGKEEYNASYLMGNFNLGQKVDFIIGIRKESNKTIYYSWETLDHPFSQLIFNGERVNYTRNNTFYLPALFINFKPSNELIFRYAQTYTLARPDYINIIPLRRVNGGARTIDFRNKYLSPGLSENKDISLSFHKDKFGFISVSYFQKNIEELIFSSGSRIILGDDTTKFNMPKDLEHYKLIDYILNNPKNVLLKGLEFDYQTRFWYLPSPLNGLVFNANYTLTRSIVRYPMTIVELDIQWDPFTVTQHNIDDFYTDRLIDQPNEILNFSIGYDYKGFSGRFSMLYNDDVFMVTSFWPEKRQTKDIYKRWDLSIKQKLTDSNMSVFLNISNITETNDISRYRGNTSAETGNENLSTKQYYGKTIDLGFQFSF
mgnify:CR=1 FL=1